MIRTLQKQYRLRRCGKKTQNNCTKKILMTQRATVVWSLTYSQTLWCEVKWALGRVTMNKASGDDGIPADLFQILKDNAVKVLHSMCQQIWKHISGHRTGKCQFSFQLQRRSLLFIAKERSNYHTIELISRAMKIMLKIL